MVEMNRKRRTNDSWNKPQPGAQTCVWIGQLDMQREIDDKRGKDTENDQERASEDHPMIRRKRKRKNERSLE